MNKEKIFLTGFFIGAVCYMISLAIVRDGRDGETGGCINVVNAATTYIDILDEFEVFDEDSMADLKISVGEYKERENRKKYGHK